MKWWGYLICAALVLASFPLSIALSRQAVRKGNVAGVTMMVGMAFMTVADPKMAAAIELIQQRKEIGDTQEDTAADAFGDRLA